MLVFAAFVLCAALLITTFAFASLQNRSSSSTWLPVRRLLGIFVLCANIEERRLLCGVFAQFRHLVHRTCNRLLLFSPIFALRFVSLSLLPRVFLLALCEC